MFDFPKTLHQLHLFETDGVLYAADIEKARVVEVSTVMADILELAETQTNEEILQTLKPSYIEDDILEAFERFEELDKEGLLFNRGENFTETRALESERRKLLVAIPGITIDSFFDIETLYAGTNMALSYMFQHLTEYVDIHFAGTQNRKPKLLVPFHFTKEKTSLDYVTNLNRYQLLIHLAKAVELETLTFSEAGKTDLKPEDFQGLGEIQIRNIAVEESDAFSPPWYAMDGYDGMLLLSQFLMDDLLYYQIPDVPIVHCIEDDQRLQGSTLETLLNVCAFQNVKDTLVVRASWVKEWLRKCGVPRGNVRVVPNGINVGEPIGKLLAKQHTAALFKKPIFTQQPVVGFISGFEPNYAVKLISAFARANPHLAIFVYDPFLAEHYTHPPSNVVIFSVDDEETHSILPIFFQALDLVCFPAIPGTPLSLVLEAMAYGTPCVAMTTYGLPPEVAGAGAVVKFDRNVGGTAHTC